MPLPMLARRTARLIAAAPLALLLGLLAACGSSLPQVPSVAISPVSAALQAGLGTQQFTATVSDAQNTSVVWKVNGMMGGNAGVGTVSATGLYDSPATAPTAGSVVVSAVSVANSNYEASATVTLAAAVVVTLTPATTTVAGGATAQFSAIVTNATNTGVTWTVNGSAGGSATVGTISAGGLYTAPASFPGLSQVTITATSVQDASKSASATVTLAQTVAVSVAPAAVSVALGARQIFTAAVSGTANAAVVWSVNGVNGGNATVGTIDASGAFTAPAQLPSPAAETITASSVADATKSGSAMATITAPVGITITPATATLGASGTQQFTAQVTNAVNTAVSWSVNGAAGGSATVGTITANGFYTAPATFPGLNQVTVQVASAQDATKTAQAVVTLVQPVSVAITPTAVTVNLGTTQPFAATVTGSANTAVNWSVNGVVGGSQATGLIDANGNFAAPSQLPPTALETVTATSQADPTKSATAAVTLQVPPNAFTLSPASTSLSVAKSSSVSQAFQLTASAGFNAPVAFTVAGMPLNVTATLDHTSLSGSGTVHLSLAAAAVSLATGPIPVTLTASATDSSGNALVQTATVLLTVTGWAGHIRTLAGGGGGVGFEDGGGAADELDASAVTSDGGQNLYFSDSRGSALRGFDLVQDQVATLVGGPYNFTIPDGEGMAFDAATNTVYIADGQRNQVISYVLGSFNINVVAGSGISGYADGTGTAAQLAFPHGLALSPDGATLYLADTNNETIRAINVATGAVTTLAGQHGIYRSQDGVGAAASFCQPTGLAIDGAGANLYVTDNCGYVVRQIALASATVTTVAGTGAIGQADGAALSATFRDLNGLRVDPHAGAQVIYLTDYNEIRVLVLGAHASVYTLAGEVGPAQSDGTGSQAGFDGPNDLTALADIVGTGTTSLFIADTSNGLLRRLDFTNPLTATSAATANLRVTTIAGQPSHRGNSDGPGTGADYAGASTAEFSLPQGIVTDGKVAFVADALNGAIREINLATTAVTTVAGPAQGYNDGPASQAAFYQDAGLAWVASQNTLYIADTGNGAIRKLDLTAQTVTTIAGANASGYVDGALLDARFNHPYGILASADATKLYIGDTGNNVIRLIDLTAGTVSTIAGSGGLGSADGIGGAARFAEPAGLAFDAASANIFIADFENHAIRELNLATDAVTTIVGLNHACGFADGAAATATLCTPALVTSDGRSLFWGDSDTGLLRVLDLATMQVSTLAGSPGLMHMVDGDLTETAGELTGPVRYNGVFGLAIAPDSSILLFTEKTANVVRILY